MSLESTPPLSIKNQSGYNRNIAQEVDGNNTGDKSLWALGVTAGKTSGGVSMLEFLGYTKPAPPPTTVYVSWEINGCSAGRGHLTITDNASIVRVDLDSTSTPQSGSFTLPSNSTYLPYTITVRWVSGSGNIVRFRVCNGNDGTTQYTSPDITVFDNTDSFTVTPTPTNVHIQMTSCNVALNTCAIPPPV